MALKACPIYNILYFLFMQSYSSTIKHSNETGNPTANILLVNPYMSYIDLTKGFRSISQCSSTTKLNNLT